MIVLFAVKVSHFLHAEHRASEALTNSKLSYPCLAERRAFTWYFTMLMHVQMADASVKITRRVYAR